MSNVVPLLCATQKYSWGKHGNDSAVYRLHCEQVEFLRRMIPTLNSEAADSPYAELWMGTHPNGPSFALIPQENGAFELTLLNELIENNPEKWLGNYVISQFGKQLPFLLKVCLCFLLLKIVFFSPFSAGSVCQSSSIYSSTSG